MRFHGGWRVAGIDPDAGSGRWPACLGELPAPFDEPWIESLISYDISSDKAAIRNGPLSAGDLADLPSVGQPSRHVVLGSFLLADERVWTRLDFDEFGFQFELHDGYAASSINELLVERVLSDFVATLTAGLDWLRPPAVEPLLAYPSAPDVLQGIRGVPDTRWKGGSPGPVLDYATIESQIVDDEVELRARTRWDRIRSDRSNAAHSAFMFPTSLHDLLGVPTEQSRTIVAMFAGTGVVPEAEGLDASVDFEVRSSGVVARLRMDRRYGVRDVEIADAVARWFDECIRLCEPTWAIASPVALPDSSLALWLAASVDRGGNAPPISTWLQYDSDNDNVVRSGPGPFPSRSELDRNQPVPGVKAASLDTQHFHPLDQLVIPTSALSTVVRVPNSDVSLARRQQLTEVVSATRIVDRPWSLVSVVHGVESSLALTGDDWSRFGKLIGPNGFEVVATAMSGRVSVHDVFRDVAIDPVSAFLQTHERVDLVPRQIGSISLERPHRRAGKPPPPPAGPDSLDDAQITLRYPDGKLRVETAIDVFALVTAIDTETAELLVDGTLTVGHLRRRPRARNDTTNLKSVLDTWLAEVEAQGIDPDTRILIQPRRTT